MQNLHVKNTRGASIPHHNHGLGFYYASVIVSLCVFILEPLGLTGRLIHYSTPVRMSLLRGAQRVAMVPVTSKAMG